MNKKLTAGTIIALIIIISTIPSTEKIIQARSSQPLSDSNTLYVGGTGSNNYTTIQDAIDNASDGDTVFVYDDSSPYYEHVNVNKSINLIGEDKNTTIIDGDGIGDVVYISADEMSLRGFTIRSSGGPISFGVYLDQDSDNNVIMNNIITNCDNGILIRYSSGNIISYNEIVDNDHRGISLYFRCDDNIITDNNLSYNNCGVAMEGDTWVIGSNNNIIMNNTITHNRYLGIFLYHDVYDTTITKNRVTDNTYDGIAIQFFCHGTVITDNVFANQERGVTVLCWSDYVEILYNSIINHSDAGIFTMDGTSHSHIYRNIVQYNDVGMRLWETNHLEVVENAIAENNLAIELKAIENPDYFYHNDFINNTEQVYDHGENRSIWYNETLHEGNYWSNYNGTDVDGDGIGDTPYNISDQGLQDLYPLMKPFNMSNRPPVTPNNPDPEDGATNVDVDTVLSWRGGDPNPYDIVTYDVYFGKTSTPPKRVSNQSSTSYDPEMNYETKY